VDLKNTYPLQAILVTVPFGLVALMVSAGRGLECDGPRIFESLGLTPTLAVSSGVASLAED
jgi:hypothetical protein